MGRWKTFKYASYLPAVVQFFFGALFSACTVYYFKSTSSFPAFLFIIGLACLLVGNEFLEKKYSNGQVAFTLWAVCAFMIFNFLLPVFTHQMDWIIFLTGVAAALLLSVLIKNFSGGQKSMLPVYGVYAVLIVLYFTNIIPPVPLSRKDMGIYHSVKRVEKQYVCTMQKPAWYEFYRKGELTYQYVPGDTVFCYSSIFAPTRLQKKIYHEWFFKHPQKGYIGSGRFGYNLTGGRAEGYRGFTYKKNIRFGRWKVALKTEEGKTVGVVYFTIVPADTMVQRLFVEKKL